MSINYRLGIFGFLTLGNEEIPGNAGLKDQSLALKWVQDNIRDFKGDPDSVTIFGVSAGAASVGFHLISPFSKGLFKRAILQSGSALAFWASKPKKEAFISRDRILNHFNCTLENGVDCLQSQNEENLKKFNFVVRFAIEETDFLPKKPDSLLKESNLKDVEIILGTTKDEGIFPVSIGGALNNPQKWKEWQKNIVKIGALNLLGKTDDITEKDRFKINQIIDFYLGSVQNLNEKNLQKVFDMLTDAWFLYPSYKTWQILTENGVKTYFYILSYKGDFSTTQYFGVENIGVSHGDDLFYLFKHNAWTLKLVNLTKNEDILLRKEWILSWTNFAKNGNPVTEKWNFLPQNFFFNISGVNSEMDENGEILKRMDFWIENSACLNKAKIFLALLCTFCLVKI